MKCPFCFEEMDLEITLSNEYKYNCKNGCYYCCCDRDNNFFTEICNLTNKIDKHYTIIKTYSDKKCMLDILNSNHLSEDIYLPFETNISTLTIQKLRKYLTFS